MKKPRCSEHKDRKTFPVACDTCRRIKIEQDVVGRAVDALLAAGYRIAVSLERGYDVDEMLLGSRDRDAVLTTAFAGDECHLFMQPADGPTVERGQVVSEGWVALVFGNDGWDVISDYTMGLEQVLAPVNDYADTMV